MCGIFGYIGKRDNALEVVIKGLQKLEYRGYDSWGVATDLNGELFCHKTAGKISEARLEDFADKKAKGDPLFANKKRVLIFDNKGTGPCRQ